MPPLRVLFLTHRLPFAPDRGDRIRAYHLLRHMKDYAEVDLLSLAHSPEEVARVADLAPLVATAQAFQVPRVRNLASGIAQLASRRPLTHILLNAKEIPDAIAELASTRRPDVVLAYCSGMAQFALHPALRQIPLVLDMVDVDSLKWLALSERSRPPLRWVYAREANTLRNFETHIVAKARATLVTTARERDALAHLPGAERVIVVENGVDAEMLRPQTGPASTHDLVFCGVMNYSPNVDGVLWMVEHVWPLVRRKFPNARFKIVGSSPVPRISALGSTERGIVVTGYVPDVRPELWSSAVAVAPLLVARGIQNKVLEAIAAGLPVVITPQVASGLPPVAGAACVVESSPEAYAGAICDLLALEPTRRRQFADRADLASLTWPQRLSPVRGVIEAAHSRA